MVTIAILINDDSYLLLLFVKKLFYWEIKPNINPATEVYISIMFLVNIFNQYIFLSYLVVMKIFSFSITKLNYLFVFYVLFYMLTKTTI